MKLINKFALVFAALIISTVLVEKHAHADYLPEEKTAAEAVDGFDLMLEYMKEKTFTPSRIEFSKMSADPVADLIKIATKSRYSAALRGRAIQSLALYQSDDRAEATIDKLYKTTRPGKKLFPAIVVAYAQFHMDDVAEEIAELAQHRRKDVRLAAIIALGRFGGQAGYDALLQLAETEKDSQLKARIQDYVQ